MINTINIKQKQFEVFRVGNKKSKEVILIIGSCRSVPYLNYLDHYNKTSERFLIYFIDPFNYNWDAHEQRVNAEEVITKLETDENLLSIIKSTTIFIHEYYANYGMFNTFKDSEKNIYKFGMNPQLDITIPNFHDLFILFNDIVKFDYNLKKMAEDDIKQFGILTDYTLSCLKSVSDASIEKFYSICKKSDFPEMETYFRENYLTKRLFWTYNHVSSLFTLKIFEMMNEKFLHLELPSSYWNNISKHDMYANNYESPTKYDKLFYNYQWEQESEFLIK